AESVRALTDLLVDSSESPWTVELLRPNLEEADRTAIEVEELETVSRAITLSDFVPDEQEDKIEILDDLAFFLEPLQMYSETPPEPTTAAEAAAAIAQLKTSMTTRTTDEQDSESMRSGMRRLGAALDRFLARVQTADDADAEVRRLERNMLGELPQWIEDLQRALLTEPVDVDDLPPNLIARYIAADGRARVEVFAEGDLSEPGRLETFVSSMQDYDSHVGGYAVEIIESGRAIVHSLRQAFTTALFVVAAILLFMWRSARDTALVLASLLLAALMTAAATVVFDLPFNFADVIVLPLLLGIGVDSGIHLVHRHRQGGDASSIMQSSTAKAVLFSALTTIASFGSLGFSSHLGIASLGQLLATGLLLMLVANLIFLPALLAYTDRRRLRKANAAVPSAH
ncbi:MAG TPA: MMPL family transporter, partial [Gammaproteobacteria bacterium]